MKTKVFLLALLHFICLASMADEYVYWVPKGNITYDLNLTKRTAEVRYCDNVVSITIPSSITYNSDTYKVTIIKPAAFSQNTSLTSLTLPEGLKTIGSDAFCGCASLKSIVIPSTVNDIGINIFSQCISLTSIKVTSGNNTYDSRNNCNAIIKTYGNKLIAGCMNTIIPYGVFSIEWGAFNGCIGLKSITIPSTVTSIGEAAFNLCIGITSITIPSSVTSIGGSAFRGCSGITSINIPNSVNSIGDYAFENCTSLTNVTIGNCMTEIGGGAFNNTPWLESQPDGLIYIGEYAYIYKGTMPPSSEIVIAEGTKGICGGAFRQCNNLSSVTLPNSLTSIGAQAFSGCSSLTSVTVPKNVNKIGSWAFSECI